MEKSFFHYGGTITSSLLLTGNNPNSHRSTNPLFVYNDQQPVSRLRI